MKNIQELYDKRKGIRDQALAILDTAEKEARDMTGDELTKYEGLDAEIDNLTREIDAINKMTERQRKAGETEAQQIDKDQQRDEEPKTPVQTEQYRDAYRSYLKYGILGCTPEERTIIDKGRSSIENRALSAVTGTAGGYLVPQGFFNELERAMTSYGGMRDVARIIRTSGGNDLPMPNINDTSNEGELVAENGAVGSQDVAFTQIIMKAYKYSSKTVLIPIELLQDSAIDAEAEVLNALAERTYRITNRHFTVGDNADKPQGAVTGAVLGKTGANGQTTSIIYDDLIDLIYSVPAPYRKMKSCGFMLADTSIKALRKLKDAEQRPLWEPSIKLGEPDMLSGYRIIPNEHMPVMAASAKSILFGDFSKYIIREVMDVMIVRIAEKYIENGQVGFLCFSRQDGRLRDAGTHPLAYYQNSAV